MKRLSLFCAALIVALISVTVTIAAEPRLQSGDYVAVIGDSITEQKLYSLYIEDYLLMCQAGRRSARHTVRLGW